MSRLLQGGAGSSRYAGHVPTTLLEKALLGSSSAILALASPREAHLVGVVGETTGAAALRRLLFRMEKNPVGRTILQDRPQITSKVLPLHSLHKLPADSFGAAYARFLERNAFDPDDRSPVRFVDDPDLAYVMLRYRQIHDLWHVLYDLPPTFMGEVALKWLEAAQTGLPMCALGAMAGGIRLKPRQRSAIAQHVLPWALRHAMRGPDLMSVYYERELPRSLEDVRNELGIEVLPRKRIQ